MTQNELLKGIIKALDDKKGEDIQAIDIGDLTIIADYFIIVNGTSTTHTKALADEVEYQIGQLGRKPDHVEGYAGSTWIILDYGDIVVHVFYKETREFYSLERLWSDGKQIDISDFIKD